MLAKLIVIALSMPAERHQGYHVLDSKNKPSRITIIVTKALHRVRRILFYHHKIYGKTVTENLISHPHRRTRSIRAHSSSFGAHNVNALSNEHSSGSQTTNMRRKNSTCGIRYASKSATYSSEKKSTKRVYSLIRTKSLNNSFARSSLKTGSQVTQPAQPVRSLHASPQLNSAASLDLFPVYCEDPTHPGIVKLSSLPSNAASIYLGNNTMHISNLGNPEANSRNGLQPRYQYHRADSYKRYLSEHIPGSPFTAGLPNSSIPQMYLSSSKPSLITHNAHKSRTGCYPILSEPQQVEKVKNETISELFSKVPKLAHPLRIPNPISTQVVPGSMNLKLTCKKLDTIPEDTKLVKTNDTHTIQRQIEDKEDDEGCSVLPLEKAFEKIIKTCDSELSTIASDYDREVVINTYRNKYLADLGYSPDNIFQNEPDRSGRKSARSCVSKSPRISLSKEAIVEKQAGQSFHNEKTIESPDLEISTKDSFGRSPSVFSEESDTSCESNEGNPIIFYFSEDSSNANKTHPYSSNYRQGSSSSIGSTSSAILFNLRPDTLSEIPSLTGTLKPCLKKTCENTKPFVPTSPNETEYLSLSNENTVGTNIRQKKRVLFLVDMDQAPKDEILTKVTNFNMNFDKNKTIEDKHSLIKTLEQLNPPGQHVLKDIVSKKDNFDKSMSIPTTNLANTREMMLFRAHPHKYYQTESGPRLYCEPPLDDTDCLETFQDYNSVQIPSCTSSLSILQTRKHSVTEDDGMNRRHGISRKPRRRRTSLLVSPSISSCTSSPSLYTPLGSSDISQPLSLSPSFSELALSANGTCNTRATDPHKQKDSSDTPYHYYTYYGEKAAHNKYGASGVRWLGSIGKDSVRINRARSLKAAYCHYNPFLAETSEG